MQTRTRILLGAGAAALLAALTVAGLAQAGMGPGHMSGKGHMWREGRHEAPCQHRQAAGEHDEMHSAAPADVPQAPAKP